MALDLDGNFLKLIIIDNINQLNKVLSDILRAIGDHFRVIRT